MSPASQDEPSAPRVLRGRLLGFLDDPAEVGSLASYRYIEDGALVMEAGRITELGDAGEVLRSLSAETPVDHYPDALILPGFIDTHIHLPQTQVIASYGAQLLDWLERYAFVEEQKFADPDHAERIAGFFLDELLRNGTTTAAVYGSVHPQSAEAFFAEASKRNLRMIAGKVLMDRDAPAGLMDSAERGFEESRALIERWHGQGRLHYAVTPRFAVTSSEAQLEAAGALLQSASGLYMQTHLSENAREIETVKTRFPWAESYTHVYDRFGLLGPRALFGHCLHLEAGEKERLSATRSVAVFCPTSNLFLGSGLFNLADLCDPRRPIPVGIATDVGGGTSYSMLRTAAEAYKVLQLRGQNFPALDAFYRLTLGNARALGLEDKIGSLAPGSEADLVVLDSRATPAMAHRMETVEGNLEAELFLLMTLGDERAVRATYAGGSLHHAR